MLIQMASVSYPILPRLIYAVLWLMVFPAVIMLLLFRSLGQPAYRRHLAERFARYPTAASKEPLWCHAASMGEVHALKPLLVAMLRRRSPPKRSLQLELLE
mgnify:CR=1 FL=1